jgi:hypothetical protein
VKTGAGEEQKLDGFFALPLPGLHRKTIFQLSSNHFSSTLWQQQWQLE